MHSRVCSLVPFLHEMGLTFQEGEHNSKSAGFGVKQTWI